MEARASCGPCWCRVCVAARQTRQAAVKVGLQASPYPRHLCLGPWFLCHSSSLSAGCSPVLRYPQHCCRLCAAQMPHPLIKRRQCHTVLHHSAVQQPANM